VTDIFVRGRGRRNKENRFVRRFPGLPYWSFWKDEVKIKLFLCLISAMNKYGGVDV
jgi:hypothetical protein